MSELEPKRRKKSKENNLGSTHESLLQEPKILWEYKESLQYLYFRVGQQTNNRDTFLIPGKFLPNTNPTVAFNTSTGLLESLHITDAIKQQPQPDKERIRYLANMMGEKTAKEIIRYEQEERIPQNKTLIKDFLGEKAAALFHHTFTTDNEVSLHRTIDLDREEMEALTQIWPQKYAELLQTQQSFETRIRSIPGAVFAEEDPRANKQSPHHLFPE